MKATYGEITHTNTILQADTVFPIETIEPREIFKDPITDDGTKKSKKGLLIVQRVAKRSSLPEKNPIDINTRITDYTLVVNDQQTWEEEKTGLLQTVFKDGVLVRETTLEEIRQRLTV